jgi:hypothetical protein
MSEQNPEIMSHDEIIEYYEAKKEALDPNNKNPSGGNRFHGDQDILENLRTFLETLKNMKKNGKPITAIRPEKDDPIALAIFETAVEGQVGKHRRSTVKKQEPHSTEALENA